jgi:hypothetical protein
VQTARSIGLCIETSAALNVRTLRRYTRNRPINFRTFRVSGTEVPEPPLGQGGERSDLPAVACILAARPHDEVQSLGFERRQDEIKGTPLQSRYIKLDVFRRLNHYDINRGIEALCHIDNIGPGPVRKTGVREDEVG